VRHIFPYFLATLDIFAFVFYLINKDYWRAVYWFNAAVLTFSTTKM